METTEIQKNFLVTEYIQLRNEIMFCIQGIEDTERYAIIFSGGIWAWLATQTWSPAFVVVLTIPALLTKLLDIKARSLANAINKIATYIQKIEDTIGITDERAGQLGWEHREKNDEKEHSFKNWAKLYWGLLFWGNIIIGLIYFITGFIVRYKLL